MGLYTSRHPIARLELVSRPFLAFVRFYCRLRVEGLEHIPQSGAFILAANHSSHADTAVIFAAVTRPMRKRLVAAAAQDYFFDNGRDNDRHQKGDGFHEGEHVRLQVAQKEGIEIDIVCPK